MQSNMYLRILFIFGAVLDSLIAISWFFIAAGWDIPNILNGYVGEGADYRLAMFIAGMFMAGWATILAWGSFKPVERRGLLLITAIFLTLSVVLEIVLFSPVLSGAGFIVGVIKRLIISLIFTLAWFRFRRA